MVIVDGEHIAWREGMTVADILEEMGDGHDCPVVRLNGAFVARSDFHRAHVPDDTEIHLLHLIAGG
jgi:thiamine biosynthesis protein ThiS